MRFMECLNQSDAMQLARIAKNHHIDGPTYSKNTILQELISKFTEPGYLDLRLQHSRTPFQAVVRELAQTGRDRYAKEELSPVIHRILGALKMDQANTQAIMADLIQEGLLFEMRSAYGRIFVFPEDLWKKILKITMQSQASAHAFKQEPLIIRDEGTAMARDAAAMLFFCAKIPQRLTLDGSLYRRAQQQIMQLFEVSEELLPERTGWRFGFHPHYQNYPERFALIYDFWSTSGAWLEGDGMLQVREGVGQAVLMFSEEKRTELLFRYYLQVYRSAIPHLLRIINKIGDMARAGWVETSALGTAIQPFVSDYYYESKEKMVQQHILQMLVYLGFLLEGEFTQNQIGYQLSPLGETWLGQHGFSERDNTREQELPSAGEAVTITPDFEMIVPSRIESIHGFSLQKIAKRIKNERVRIFRLTRESIEEALANGWTKDRLLSFLEEISQHPLPKNVEVTLIAWCDVHKPISSS